ncbi:MAG: c-type cytochrome [Isosphaeraceae bacterium]
MTRILGRTGIAAAILILLATAATLAASGRRASALQDPADDDETAYREAMVRKSMQDNCLICHTEDMIAGQRLTAALWKAEVDKMITWGSPLPKEAAAPLVEYLARKFSDREPSHAPARSTLSAVDSLETGARAGETRPPAGDPGHGEKLYVRDCATCHGPAALGGDLGPSLVGKAILSHPREYDRILDQGLRRMPGFRLTMNARDRADVLAWLRSRTYPEAVGPR